MNPTSMQGSQAQSFPTIKLSSPATREFWEMDVVYEDEHLFVLNKPAGLLTSPDRYDPNRPNLMRLLHDAIAAGKPWAKERGLTYLSNVHRLDFPTSGVLLLAKSKTVLVHYANLFGSNKPVKTYSAFVHGGPEFETFTVDTPISPHMHKLGLMRIDSIAGKKSKTEFEVVERYRGYTWLHCRPITGRTHQIRVHLKSVQLPICGDLDYGGGPLLLSRIKKHYELKPGRGERPLLGTTALHAESLTVPHYVTGESVTMTAPWPKDMSVALKFLRRPAPIRGMKYGGDESAPEVADSAS